MKHLFRQNIIVYTSQSLDRYAEVDYATSQTYKGRFVFTDQVIRVGNNETIQADAKVFLPTEVSGLKIGDKLVYNSEEFKIISFKEARDDLGNSRYYKVMVQRWNA